ncbi:hypothetical protein E4U56_000059 [Claviceps arundinis]|uniref:Uncharacterized protein n=1 Tax=Claviceps arundinis TaxID=1623583 RepID=A0A9P7N0B0_9HYPO|nr:hypothetical protein E4U56_000059 [Claviceps arundinis]
MRFNAESKIRRYRGSWANSSDDSVTARTAASGTAGIENLASFGVVPKDAGRPENATVSGFVAASSRRLRPSSSLPEVEDRKPEIRMPKPYKVSFILLLCI